MEGFLRGLEMDKRSGALLTTAACGLGVLLVLVRTVSGRQTAKVKIERARSRRTESLQRAEQAVLRYRATVRVRPPGREDKTYNLPTFD